jgi:PIN domain nuclease of toxin-antitoxin system
VRLLLDTHFILWWLAGSSKLGVPARRLIGSADCAASTASFVEMRMKCAKGKLSLPGVAQLQAQLDAERIQVLALTPAHVDAGARFEQTVADPMDRLLLGTAAVEGRVLLTRDAVLLALADRASLKFVREG